jgi:hypothetical protein
MLQTPTAGKATDDLFQQLGWGHHNLLLIKDYASGGRTFRAETEIRLTDENQADFERIEVLLEKDPRTDRETAEIVTILHRQVDLLSAEPGDARSADGKKRAKAIFSAAFGLLG